MAIPSPTESVGVRWGRSATQPTQETERHFSPTSPTGFADPAHQQPRLLLSCIVLSAPDCSLFTYFFGSPCVGRSGRMRGWQLSLPRRVQASPNQTKTLGFSVHILLARGGHRMSQIVPRGLSPTQPSQVLDPMAIPIPQDVDVVLARPLTSTQAAEKQKSVHTSDAHFDAIVNLKLEWSLCIQSDAHVVAIVSEIFLPCMFRISDQRMAYVDAIVRHELILKPMYTERCTCCCHRLPLTVQKSYVYRPMHMLLPLLSRYLGLAWYLGACYVLRM